jgi:hypothetical protein
MITYNGARYDTVEALVEGKSEKWSTQIGRSACRIRAIEKIVKDLRDSLRSLLET